MYNKRLIIIFTLYLVNSLVSKGLCYVYSCNCNNKVYLEASRAAGYVVGSVPTRGNELSNIFIFLLR